MRFHVAFSVDFFRFLSFLSFSQEKNKRRKNGFKPMKNNIDMCDSSVCQDTTTILDSKHISATKKIYDIKLVDCGEYCQLYLYEDRKVKTNSVDNTDLELKKAKIDRIFDKEKSSKVKKLSEVIRESSITRSKIECQRLAKANINDWKIFITLTFEKNITDVKYANKRFKYFIDKVRRVKPELKYLCITEFQKRGATHYHMLCNIDINDKDLIYSQVDSPKFKHVKYWIDGFTSVEVMKGDPKKIINYIGKYMTKDIDNRLFGHHRYFGSRNLNKPCASYIDMMQKLEKKFYEKKVQDMEIIYQNEYVNPYDNSNVKFIELKKCDTVKERVIDK